MPCVLFHYDGAHGKHVGTLPAETSDADADEYCRRAGFPGWVRRNGVRGGQVYILARGTRDLVIQDYNLRKYQDAQRREYDTHIVE